jgi:hypothetical protein
MLNRPEDSAGNERVKETRAKKLSKKAKTRHGRSDGGGRSQPPSSSSYPNVDVQRDREYNLTQSDLDDWERQSPEMIERYYAQAESDFFQIVNEYLDEANRATRRYKELSVAHSRWRFWTIVATGGLAALNVCASLELLNIPVLKPNTMLPAVLTAIAAIYAGALTVAGNLENFFNAGEKSAGFRESRDLLLNRYHVYCFKWFYYVEANGKNAAACMNAGRLYRQLIDDDRDLRQKLKQWTEVQARGIPEGGGKPPSAHNPAG